MGQQRSKRCPICEGQNGGKWTCPRCTRLVAVHRELLRNLQAWRYAYEAGEVSDVLDNGERSYSLWDILALYEARGRLAPQQATAIELFLYNNIAERDAAVAMGASEKSPVAIYATVGIARLLGMSRRGEIRYRMEEAS